MLSNQQEDMDEYGTCRRDGEKFLIGGGDYSQGWSSFLLRTISVKLDWFLTFLLAGANLLTLSLPMLCCFCRLLPPSRSWYHSGLKTTSPACWEPSWQSKAQGPGECPRCACMALLPAFFSLPLQVEAAWYALLWDCAQRPKFCSGGAVL